MTKRKRGSRGHIGLVLGPILMSEIAQQDLPTGLPWIIDDMTDAGGGCFPTPREPAPEPVDTAPWWLDETGCFPPGPGPGLPYDLYGEDNGSPSGGGITGMLGKILDVAEKAAKGASGASSGEASPFEDMIVY